MKTSRPVWDISELTGINRNIYFAHFWHIPAPFVLFGTVFWWNITCMNDVVYIQLEQPEHSKNNQNTASMLWDKEEHYTFSMHITRNEKIFVLGRRRVLNSSKLSCWPVEVAWMRSTLFEFIGICQIDQEWSPDRTRIVNSSTFGSWFLNVRLGH